MGFFDFLSGSEDPEDYVGGSIPSPEEETLPDDPYQKFLEGLNSTIGSIFGAAKKPVDWLASREVGPDILSTNPAAISTALARESVRPVETRPAEETLADVLFPKKLAGDIDQIPTAFGEGGEVLETRPPTPEEQVFGETVNRLGRKATTTIGGFALNPATYALGLKGVPGKAVAAGFIPGMSESLGEQGGKAISAYESGDIPGMAENIFGAGLDTLFLGGMAKHIAGREVPVSSEVKQSEPVTEPSRPELNLETAAPRDIPEITNIQDLVSTPHEQLARESFSKYIDDIKGEVARVTGQEHIADAKVEYVPDLGTVRYEPTTNTIQMDPTFLFRDPAKLLAETGFHELSHGGKTAKHQFGDIEYTGEMVPGPKGRPIAEAINKIELGKLPSEEGVPTPDTYEIDAGELGLTPKQLSEAGNYAITDPALHEHYTPNMPERAASFAPNEVEFMSAFNAARNNPATMERAQKFEQEMAGIQKEARRAELEAKGLKPVRSYEEVLADIQAGRETEAPRSKDIEREALTQYAKEQDAIVKQASTKFQSAKTEAERSEASKEFQKAKSERDRIQARITQLGGEKVTSEPVQEVSKQVTEPKPTPTKAEEVTETPPSEKVVSAPANNLRRLLEGMGLSRFNVNKLPETFRAEGLEFPKEFEAQLPGLVKELKDRGWVNEKLGGTYTLLTAPPKTLKGVSGGKIADVTNVRESLKESLKSEPVTETGVKAPTPTPTIRPGQFHFDETGRRWEVRKVEGDQVTISSGRGGGEKTQVVSKDDILARRGIMPGKETAMSEEPPKPTPEEEIDIDLSGLEEGTKPPNLADKMKQKLTPDELQAIAKLFGGEVKKKGTSETPPEVLAAQKAALRGLVEKETKGGANIPPTEIPPPTGKAPKGEGPKQEKTGFLENPAVRVLNAVKSITFGGDVGHLLRQGKQMNADLLFSKHAKKVVDQIPTLWKLAKGGMKELETLNDKLYSDPDIRMMVDDFGMDMPGMGKGLKEEAFHGAGLAENLPVIGKHYVERSEAVYTGGLNYLRAATAKKWIESLQKEGFTPKDAPEKYNAVARAVNIISQRGSFSPAYQKLFSDASAIYGAPRAKAARLQNAFELFRGGTSGRVVRTTAAKTLAFNAGLYGLLAATTGAKLITDPEASDFGKIRVNDKITVDPWMGLGVTARTVAKLVTGKARSPYTGKDYPVSPSDALSAEFLGGIAPGVKMIWEAMSGKDLRGYQTERLSSLLNVAPLTAKSIQELFKEGDIDEAIELSLLQFAGEGVDVFNYEESKAKQARLRAERGLSTGRSGRKKKRTYAFD